MSELNIAVLGAGVVGLTTAVELQKQYRHAKICVIADRFDDDTTSAVAAGLFRPGTSFAGPSEDLTRKWINDAYSHWEGIRGSIEGARAGVVQVSGYIFSSKHPSIVRNPYIEKLVPLYRRATEEELVLCPGQWKYGSFFTTILAQCSIYLPWTMAHFQSNGGQTHRCSVSTFAAIDQSYDIVVNCTGLGAKYLCNDNKLVPLRGQVLKVAAPWLKTFFYADYDTYVIPGFDSVTLGGCRQYDSYDCSTSKYDGLAIRERCEALLPSLRTAKLLEQKVGLRPHRDPVRVEKEILPLASKTLKIVHNYGHGGYGVTTAPGTALYAVKLVHEMLSGNSKL